jgi:gliding motility-associated-like protein
VKITSGSCVISDTVNVSGSTAESAVYVPNSFTPNGDIKNAVFYAYGEDISEFHMQVFDRWGQLIFTSNSISDGWDGTVKGRVVQEDVYIWRIVYMSNCSGLKEIEKLGQVTVIK